jgi:hypothetical protein
MYEGLLCAARLALIRTARASEALRRIIMVGPAYTQECFQFNAVDPEA